MFANRPICVPLESACVSEHLNVLITVYDSNAKRDYRQGKLWEELSGTPSMEKLSWA
jgi:hypothetical protein